MNRTFMEMVCSKMAHAGLPDKYCAEAVDAVAYIIYIYIYIYIYILARHLSRDSRHLMK